ncbi:MAG TPA: AmmeMemoRadiSam system protein B [Acidimicrobiales bacterium]|nr:AmmeMemoRadiSam system protein B [Acidimicrobiales bacterium]
MTVAGGVRPPAVAGLFYPADPGELRDEIARYLDAAAAFAAGSDAGAAIGDLPAGAGATGDGEASGPGASHDDDRDHDGDPRGNERDRDSHQGTGEARGDDRPTPAPDSPDWPGTTGAGLRPTTPTAAAAAAAATHGLAQTTAAHAQAAVASAPKAVIAPHAGYRYSGATAGYAYHALAPRRGQVERVVVVGPAHRVRVAGVGLSTARAWATPFGPLEVDAAACCELAEMPGVVVADDAHAPEHSIEVHLPFVHEVFGEVSLVPLVVGRATVAAVAQVLDAVWGGPETAIVVSSDLSHYLDETAARRRDRATVTAIVEGRAADIGPQDACGCLPIGGLLTAAVGHGLAPRLLDLRTSADTAGEPSRVVGYGSFALVPPPALSDDDRRWLLDLAQRAIDHEIRTGEAYPLDDSDVPAGLRRPGATFVTLERGTELLGCIGSLDPRRALWRDVARNARGAAFEDPRFPALVAGDVAGMSIEVSVLSPLEPLPAPSLEAVAASLRPGVDGLVISAGGRRGTFLPDVWDKIPDPEAFVGELVRKARWPEPWAAGARAWRYGTTIFRSDD